MIEKITLTNIRHTDTITQTNGTYSIILPETSKNGTGYLIDRLKRLIMEYLATHQNAILQETADRLTITPATYPDDLDFINQYIDDFNKAIQHQALGAIA